jgi:hypothetical protein
MGNSCKAAEQDSLKKPCHLGRYIVDLKPISLGIYYACTKQHIESFDFGWGDAKGYLVRAN